MYRFLIPDGYIGWIRVDFNIKGALALPAEGDYLVFKIPPSGYLKTPAKYMCGYPSDYYYYSGESRKQIDTKRMIFWRGFPNREETTFEKEIDEYIFVGTEQEFEKYKDSTYKTQGELKYGNLNNSVQP